jgi:hypothetical protein
MSGKPAKTGLDSGFRRNDGLSRWRDLQPDAMLFLTLALWVRD